MSLSGRVAAITGASAGIGLACTQHLAREGVAVVLGARRVSLLDATAKQIVAGGGRAAIVQIDVTREEDVQALVATATRDFGRLDVMICNAGFGYYAPIDQMPSDVMRRMMDVNYMGTFYGARARPHRSFRPAIRTRSRRDDDAGRRPVGCLNPTSPFQAARS